MNTDHPCIEKPTTAQTKIASIHSSTFSGFPKTTHSIVLPTRCSNGFASLGSRPVSPHSHPITLDSVDDPITSPLFERDTPPIQSLEMENLTFLVSEPPSTLERVDVGEYSNNYILENLRTIHSRQSGEIRRPSYHIHHTVLRSADIEAAIDTSIYIAHRLRLSRHVMFRSVYLLHSFLSSDVCISRKILLAAVCSTVYTAAKFNRRTRRVAALTLVRMFQHRPDAFDVQTLLRLERILIRETDWRLEPTTPIDFLPRFARIAHLDRRRTNIAIYLSMLASRRPEALDKMPSLIAAASVMVALQVPLYGAPSQPLSQWTPLLHYWTSYTAEDLTPLARTLEQWWEEAASSAHAVSRVFSDELFDSVGRIPPVRSITTLV
eukprot:gnl/Dysnectes_brevis/2091_a2424_2546.p1 GENE.gnl/Dysnectes_brevis/2091_a2424_2546~~gnl/Dysnectes_brevis/2091_a2424_2546.p1  ORF type:complete len:379 (+),score=92.05 gnl/Dysnectes_brevis/2091_a2424_2546:271-1407(+)